MAHREPRPDPQQPQRRATQPPAPRPNDALFPVQGERGPVQDPGDFLGLGMELAAGARRAAAQPQPAPTPPVPPLPRAPAPPPAQLPAHSNIRHVPSSWIPPHPAQHNQPAPAPRTNLTPTPPVQPAPSSMGALMRPLVFEAETTRAAEPATRTNSWLLELDDAKAGRAGGAPVVADPGDVQRRPRVVRPLDTSFSEPVSATRGSGPWLVGLLLAAAAASLVFVIGSTLTKVDPAKLAQREDPLAPRSRPSAHEELSDPLDPHRGATRPAVKTAKVASKPIERPASPIVRAPDPEPTTAARPRPMPVEEPRTAPSQQDVFVLPDPAAGTPAGTPTETPNGAQSGTPTPQPVPDGNEQSALLAPLTPSEPSVAPWWPGALRSTPLALHENGPAPEDLAGSRERQERVAQWLMVHSRGASPREDAGAEFSRPDAPAADLEEPAARPAGAATPSTATPSAAQSNVTTNPTAPADAQPAAELDAAPAPSAIVWEGSTVPADRIASHVRVLTPQVGRVRAGLRNGSTIEGRLYAVGNGRLWIDADVGRIALVRVEIARLEQIATPPADAVEKKAAAAQRDISAQRDGAAQPDVAVKADIGVHASPPAPTAPDKTAPVIEPPPRVRVRTPGGVFFGQIVGRDGSTITLLTDEGSRIVLESDDIEPAPLSKAVVKREPTPKKGAEKPPEKQTEKQAEKPSDKPLEKPAEKPPEPAPAPDDAHPHQP